MIEPLNGGADLLSNNIIHDLVHTIERDDRDCQNSYKCYFLRVFAPHWLAPHPYTTLGVSLSNT